MTYICYAKTSQRVNLVNFFAMESFYKKDAYVAPAVTEVRFLCEAGYAMSDLPEGGSSPFDNQPGQWNY